MGKASVAALPSIALQAPARLVWAGCRFYYFLFHVLEAYAGRGRPYSGLFDALRYALKGEPKRQG